MQLCKLAISLATWGMDAETPLVLLESNQSTHPKLTSSAHTQYDTLCAQKASP